MDGVKIAAIFKGKNLVQQEEYAQLVRDAFNVWHETGVAPRELAEQRNEMLAALREALEALKDAHSRLEEHGDDISLAIISDNTSAMFNIRAAISKATGAAS
jgi:hypothetical protein